MERQPWLRLVALVAAASLVAAACGDDDEEAAPDDEVEADEDVTPGEPEPAPGFDGETIRVGALTPTSGVVEIIGTPLTAGNLAYIDYVNEELGGVAGQYPIEVVIEDTAYNPTQASSAYAAVSDDVVMLIQLLGTPIVDALLPDLIDDGMVAQPATLEARWINEPNLIPILGSYQTQVINGLDWYYSEEGEEDDVLCTLASDDEYGDAGVQGARFAADQLGVDVAEEVTFPSPGQPERPEVDFVAQVSQLEGAGCDVVFFVATASDTTNFNTALTENPDYNPTVLGQSPTWLGIFADFEYLQENFFLIAEGPEYGDESVPGMAELIRIQEEYSDVPADHPGAIYFGFGYNEAKAVVQVLEKAVELGDLSRDGILRAVEEVGTLTFDGLAGDYQYGPVEEREAPLQSSIFRPNPEIETGLEIVAQDYQADYVDEFQPGE